MNWIDFVLVWLVNSQLNQNIFDVKDYLMLENQKARINIAMFAFKLNVIVNLFNWLLNWFITQALCFFALSHPHLWTKSMLNSSLELINPRTVSVRASDPVSIEIIQLINLYSACSARRRTSETQSYIIMFISSPLN